MRQPQVKARKKLGFTRFAMLIIGLFLVCRWGLPFVISPIAEHFGLRKQVMQLVEKQYNIHLKMQNLWVEPTINHGLMMRLENVNLNAPKLGIKLNTQQIRLYLAYLPLIQQKLQPERLEIEAGDLTQATVITPTNDSVKQTTPNNATTQTAEKKPVEKWAKKKQNRLAIELIQFKIHSQFLKEKYDLDTLGVGHFLLDGITLRKSSLPNTVHAEIRNLSLLTIQGQQPWQHFILNWRWQGHLPNMDMKSFITNIEWLEVGCKQIKPNILLQQWIKQKLPTLPIQNLQNWQGEINGVNLRVLKTADSWLTAVSVDNPNQQTVTWQNQVIPIPAFQLSNQADWTLLLAQPVGLQLRESKTRLLMNRGELLIGADGYVIPREALKKYKLTLNLAMHNLPLRPLLALLPNSIPLRDFKTGVSGRLSGDTQIIAEAEKPLKIESTGRLNHLKISNRYNSKSPIQDGDIHYIFNNNVGVAIPDWSIKVNNKTLSGVASYVDLLKPQLFIASSASGVDLQDLQNLIESRWSEARRYWQPRLFGAISGDGVYIQQPYSKTIIAKATPNEPVSLHSDTLRLRSNDAITWKAGTVEVSGFNNYNYELKNLQFDLGNQNQLAISGLLRWYQQHWQVVASGEFNQLASLTRIALAYTQPSILTPQIVLPKSATDFTVSGKTNFEYAGSNNKPVQYISSSSNQVKIQGLGHTFTAKQLQTIQNNKGLYISGAGDINNAPWIITAKASQNSLSGRYQVTSLPLVLLYNTARYLHLTQALNLDNVSGVITGQGNLSGSVKNPRANGNILISNVNACERIQYNSCLQNSSGKIQISNQQIIIQDFSGNVDSYPFTLAGLFDLANPKNHHLALDLKDWSLKTLQSRIPELLKRLKQKGELLPLNFQGGLLAAHIDLKGEKLAQVSGNVHVNNLAALLDHFKLPLRVEAIEYNLASGQVNAPHIYLDKQLIQLSGQIKNSQQYNIAIQSKDISMTTILSLMQSFKPNLPLPAIIRQSGSAGLMATAQPSGLQAKLNFHDAAISTLLLPFPISHLNGQLAVTQQGKQLQLNSSQLQLRYANSPISAEIKGSMDKTLHATANIHGDMSPLLFNNLSPRINAQEPTLIHLPFDLNYTLPEQSAMLRANFVPLKAENARTILTTPTQFVLDKPNVIIEAQSTLAKMIFPLIHFETTPQDSINVTGEINSPFFALFRNFHFDVDTPKPFHLATLQESLPIKLLSDLTGTFESHLSLDGQQTVETAEGNIIITDVQSKPLKIKNITGTIDAKESEIFWDAKTVKLPGVNVSFTSHTSDMAIRPLPLEDFQLEGEQFVISQFATWFSEIFQPKLINHPFVKKWFPSKPNDALGYEIPSGQVKLKEMVLNDVIVENVTSPFQLFANGIIELSDISAESTGGQLKGNISYNPRKNNYMRAHLEYDNIQANALARVLFTLNNQIFGRISGLLDFTTEGMSQSQQLANVNGQIHFDIKDGRLPAVKRIENLMVTANTIAGGVLNLNLNSLFHVISPFQNESFNELTGDFKAVNGILTTDNLHSKGTNLDLRITGAVRMLDGDSNLQINGSVQKKIKGLFGGIGSLSIGRVVSILPSPLRKVVNWIPFVGWIPGLSKPHDDRGVGFSIQLQGPAYDPASLKNFKWLR